jgi:Zn-dependent protease
MSSFDLLSFVYFVLALLIVVTIHEFCHAWVALKLGDPTAKNAGRLTLNPLAHLDLVGTIMIFLLHIGWGKPVPVNPHYFKKPKRDEALTALAGPFSSFLLALVLSLPLKYLTGVMPQPLYDFLSTLLDTALILFIFNMLPFPPLDGSKIIGIFVPRRFQHIYQRYLQNGMIYFVVFLLFDQFVLASSFNFSILQYVIGSLFTFFKTILFLGT